MKIGIDFDNTIVNYSEALKRLSQEIPNLPEILGAEKQGIRDYLRDQGREDEWTSFQGLLYGPGMKYAKPYEGALSTIEDWIETGHIVYIVSHRTKHPYAGPSYDLHGSAMNWIDRNLVDRGTFSRTEAGERIFFLETLSAKLRMIEELGCEVFIDDLVSVLRNKEFPADVRKILFGKGVYDQLESASDWQSVKSLISI